MSNSLISSMLALEYRDVSFVCPSAALSDLPPIVPGVPEHEVAQRESAAREAAFAAAEQRYKAELATQMAGARQQFAQQLEAFARDRTAYFSRMEESLVQLALAIARKILQRESDLDPSLLAGLVRIALDRMQSGSSVQVRVLPAEAEHWRTLAGKPGDTARWQVEEDPALQPGDCIVRTAMGEANFGLEAQMSDVEQSFRGLLAHKLAAA